MKIVTISNLFASVARKLTLRTVLIVPFVLQMVGTVGLVGYLSYRNGREAVNDVASQLQIQISERVQLYLKTYLTTPHLVNRINVDAVSLGQLDLQDLPELERHLFWQLQQFRSKDFHSIGSILFGSNRGKLIALSYYKKQHIILVSDRSDTSKIYVYALDTLGNRDKLQEIFRQPDVRERPWYKAAAKAGKATWTDVFLLGDGSDLTINANRPAYDAASKELLGVFAINIEITAITQFLQGLQVGKSGKVFILERNGLLIANSSQELPYAIGIHKQLKRLKGTESKDRLIRATSQYLTARFKGEFSRIENWDDRLKFEIDGQQQFVRVMPYRDEFGLDWLIVVVVPESDFMQQINANTRTTVMLSVATLIASLGIGILTARWITKPLLGLNAAAKDIAKGKWEKTVAVNRTDEVGELASSFNSMAAQLQHSFSELQSLNTALAQSESKVNQVLEAMPVGVAVHDIMGQVIYVNQRARELLQIEILPQAKTDRLAVTYHIYQAESDLLYAEENLPIVRSLQGEKVRIDDLEVRFPDRVFPVEVYSTPLFDESGKIVGAIAAFADITERKQAENFLANYNRTLEAKVTERTAELARANSQLEQEICDRKQTEIALAAAKEAAEAASLAKSTFLANMSHELRTPLNGIMGYAQIMQRHRDCTATQRQDVEIIYKCSEHLLTLINDILSLSKIEANKLELYPEMFNFSAFLQGLSEIFRLKAQQKSIDFACPDVTQLPASVCADEKRLRQVLINLLSNAIKFTDRGSVTFKVEIISNDKADRLSITSDQQHDTDNTDTRVGMEGVHECVNFELSLTQNLNRAGTGAPSLQTQNSLPIANDQFPMTKIRFKVEDSGCGISPENLEKIFLPFEQVGDISRQAEGTGLGLAITYKLIALMESQIFVESTLGVGSKFLFDLDLPVSSDLAESTFNSLDTAIGYQGKKQKILTIDDRWENRSVIVNLLEPLGFEMAEAADGRSGLETAIEFQPDLILSDLIMPRIDGFGLIRELRQLPQFQSTIIIAVSASVFKSDRQQCLAAGFTDFLPKPIQAAELLKQIEDYLNLSWIYERESSAEKLTEAVSLAASPQEIVRPSPEELLSLYEAAKGGYVEDVDREISQLRQLNPQYKSFIARMVEFATNFEYHEIVKSIEQYLS